MRKILLDTNIIIDLLAKREPFHQDAKILFYLADKKKVSLFTSALSIANINYVLQKGRPPKEVKEILRKLNLLVAIVNLDAKVIALALNDNSFKDFEDGLQYYSALENDLDIIVTRNLKDYTNAKLPVMTAQQVNEIIGL
jgi:predicted nucleic acid-binding protein